MLDHLFLDTVGALRASLEDALLERSQEDRLVYDLFSGDLVWETSVSLPGDGDPPRVNADLSLDWQTWSQSAWRSLAMGEEVEDMPEIGIEVVFRLQRLACRPPLAQLLAVLPEESPEMGGDRLARSSPVVEEVTSEDDAQPGPEVAVEVAYEGAYRLLLPSAPAGGAPGQDTPHTRWPGQTTLAGDGLSARLGPTRQLSKATEATLGSLGAWVASTLVRLADLPLEYLPPPEDPEA
jgi:hypothetical protein